ncbi:hypothetical protein HanXRQr2_Chr11g0487561 [Helianthus annuus]|uniref:Uncharacterized protein n=1 Tax=Helianthus annuus TaxID=4232 RepID=A0A251UCC1_HELAN|nr:hypothetical protein HanXRQr2_Chr11g0487561 [Helianthus annuus]KAJ0874895.1 hypothetical protein HanPSC8_Chr11g0469761 [Helianthus annuus]
MKLKQWVLGFKDITWNVGGWTKSERVYGTFGLGRLGGDIDWRSGAAALVGLKEAAHDLGRSPFVNNRVSLYWLSGRQPSLGRRVERKFGGLLSWNENFEAGDINLRS